MEINLIERKKFGSFWLDNLMLIEVFILVNIYQTILPFKKIHQTSCLTLKNSKPLFPFSETAIIFSLLENFEWSLPLDSTVPQFCSSYFE